MWGRGDKGHFLGFEIHPLMRADSSLEGDKGLRPRSEHSGVPRRHGHPTMGERPYPREPAVPLLAPHHIGANKGETDSCSWQQKWGMAEVEDQAGGSRTACLANPEVTHLLLQLWLQYFISCHGSELCGVAAVMFLQPQPEVHSRALTTVASRLGTALSIWNL